MVTIREISAPEPGLAKELEPLLPQLNESMRRLPEELLREVIDSPYCHLLIAEQGGVAVGMLTLALYPTLTALRGWIEDVVVDQQARRQGVGRKLLRRAIEIARAEGCKSLSLTSSHFRKEAHALYLSEDFQPINTQPFRLILNK